jgi:hypothetical protein
MSFAFFYWERTEKNRSRNKGVFLKSMVVSPLVSSPEYVKIPMQSENGNRVCQQYHKNGAWVTGRSFRIAGYQVLSCLSWNRSHPQKNVIYIRLKFLSAGEKCSFLLAEFSPRLLSWVRLKGFAPPVGWLKPG